MMEDVLYLDLIGKQLSGNLQPQEERELTAWMEASPANRKFYEEMTQLWSLSAEYDAPYIPADLPKAWNRLADRIDGKTTIIPNPTPKIIPLQLKHFRTFAAIAAAIAAIAVGVWLFSPSLFQSPLETVVTAQGERRKVLMPDGSQIWLNQSSTLSYLKDFTNRAVNLEGEAFFEVKKDPTHPFVIKSGKLQTRVLGTSFNIRAYPTEQKIKVSVVTGKVEVSIPSAKTSTLLLLPGDAGVYNKKEQVLDTATTAVNPIAWKEQQLIFQSAPLKKVIPILEDYFNTTIKVANPVLLECSFTASFQYDSLETIFSVLQEALLGIKVEKQNGEYVLSGLGCQ
jgi:ferric-dicitrate binding protein FerR (iron transport regulator)